MANKHNLPPCPKCGGPMRLGRAQAGVRIHCRNYAYCGGIIHNLHRRYNNPTPKPVSLEPKKAPVSLEPKPLKPEKVQVTVTPTEKITKPVKVNLFEGRPSPGSANAGRLKWGKDDGAN